MAPVRVSQQGFPLDGTGGKEKREEEKLAYVLSLFSFLCFRIIPAYIIIDFCTLSLFLSPPLLLFYDYCLFD